MCFVYFVINWLGHNYFDLILHKQSEVQICLCQNPVKVHHTKKVLFRDIINHRFIVPTLMIVYSLRCPTLHKLDLVQVADNNQPLLQYRILSSIYKLLFVSKYYMMLYLSLNSMLNSLQFFINSSIWCIDKREYIQLLTIGHNTGCTHNLFNLFWAIKESFISTNNCTSVGLYYIKHLCIFICCVSFWHTVFIIS